MYAYRMHCPARSWSGCASQNDTQETAQNGADTIIPEKYDFNCVLNTDFGSTPSTYLTTMTACSCANVVPRDP